MDNYSNCPCCGGEAQMQKRMLYGGEVWIECKVCGMRTKYVKASGIGESEKLAKKLWERRAV